MPTLAVAKSSWPRILSGGPRSSLMRSALRRAWLTSSTSFTTPCNSTAPVSDPTLQIEVRFPALEVGAQALAKLADLLRVDPAQPLLGGRADVGLGVAQHLLPARGEVDPVATKVPVEEAVVGSAHGQRVALLALAQGQHRGLLLVLHASALPRRADGGPEAGDALLQDVVRRPVLNDVGGGHLVERSGDDDERGAGSDPSGELQGGQAVVAGNVVIGQDQVEGERAQRAFVVLRSRDPRERELPDVLPQLPLEELLVRRIVLQHEDGERVIDHFSPRA